VGLLFNFSLLLRNSRQDFDGHITSRGPSAVAEILVDITLGDTYLNPLLRLDVLGLDHIAEDRPAAVVQRRLPRQSTAVAVHVLDLQRTLRLRRLV